MSSLTPWLGFSLILGLFILYLSRLSKYLQTRHPSANPRPTPTLAEYTDGASYRDINMLDSIPLHPTHTGYAIIGGSGFLGIHLTRLLLLRGETQIRIMDITPPPADLLTDPAVHFVLTDITSLPSVRAALVQKFNDTGETPAVIFHMAAVIRFWERASYTWSLSHKINVQGTENVLAAVRELSGTKILVYTSTADSVIPRPRHLILGYDNSRYPWDRVRRSDFDPPLPAGTTSESCYTRSKKMAEDRVKAANGIGDLWTGILRPGYTIIGVNDRLISSTLNLPKVPIWDKPFTSTSVNAWDVAAAHLLYENALRQKPEEVGGDAFLVSGPRESWKLADVRNAIKHYSTRPLVFIDIPPLLIFIIAHLLEFFLFVRWHLLLFFSFLGFRRPSLFPRWLGEAVYLQPATLEYLSDIEINDERARKVLGYRPQWHMLQTIKNVVDEFESGKAGTKHGMQLRAGSEE